MKNSFLVAASVVFLVTAIGCASSPPPPPPSPPQVLDDSYRKEMSLKFAAENDERIKKIKSYVIGSTTTKEFETTDGWLNPPASQNNPWVIHLLQRSTRSRRYQDGNIESQAIYFLGTGFKVKTRSRTYKYIADIDCVLIFDNSILQDIIWQPPIKLVSSPSVGGIKSVVLKLEGQKYSGNWNYFVRWSTP
jgi:hypothetical protein